MSSLADMTTLERLDLSKCRKVTDVGVSSLARLQALSRLLLLGCYSVTTEGLRPLIELKALTTLDVSDCRALTDESAHILGRMLTLTRCVSTERGSDAAAAVSGEESPALSVVRPYTGGVNAVFFLPVFARH